MSVFDPVILALDVATVAEAKALLGRFPQIKRVKVGLQLYLAAGRTFVATLVRQGYWVFLDLKLHDIPNTVAYAIETLVDLGVGLTTVHALGGTRMIEAAVAARDRCGALTRIAAVTVLTSHAPDEWQRLGMRANIEASALRLAKLAIAAGADGLVCSSNEVAMLRRQLGNKPWLVVPGIRLPGQATDDQRRVARPGATLAAGANFLVLGRALTASANAKNALQALRFDLRQVKK